jgi:SAM-dependent methyltransferase
MGLVSVLTRWVPRTVLQRGAHVALQAVAWAYAGSRFEDPISGKSYRRMLPYGRVHSRPNALAPHSLSLERHRAVWAYLKDQTSLFEADQRLLHLAPEYCFLRKFRNMSNLDYVTGDLNSPWADHHFDCHDIPFPAESFDVAMANHLLEHVDNDRRVMAEFFRILRPGGWGIFQVPIDYESEDTKEDRSITDPMERERLYWQQDHVRLYGHQDYPQRWREAGFDVEVVDMKALLGETRYERLALHGEQWVYVVKKPL